MMIRNEEVKDYFEVENLIREAFWNVYRPGCFEHYLVHKLRDDKVFVKELDYVIEEDGKIVASIFYAKGSVIDSNNIIHEALLFGPVGVLPEYQKKGYGEKLINYTMNRAKELGYNYILITGNPNYYKKYGFVKATDYGISYDGMEGDTPFFMIKVLNDSADIPKGVYREPSCYLNIDKEELESYDKLFPAKVKERRKGQL